MKRNIVLLTTALFLTGTLAACTGSQKTDCWKAKHNTIGKDCGSGNAGYSKHAPKIKVKDKKKSTDNNTNDDDVAPDAGGGTNTNNPQGPDDNTPDPTPNDNTPDPTPNDNNSSQNNGGNASNQNNSNDIEGYDPFDNLYGPGT